jgi:hypothetical protein
MIKLPNNGTWKQPNESDKFGSIAYSKSINLDEKGYLKLSPRTVNIFDESETTANIGSTDFGYPVAFGRHGQGRIRFVTTDKSFDVTLSDTTKTIGEETDGSEPSLVDESHGVWWQNKFYAPADQELYYNDAGTWSTTAITNLSPDVRHYMTVFKNRNTLVITNGNVVKQYTTALASSTDLTLPSDFEAIGIAYNNNKVGIITRLGDSSEGQNAESFLFIWDGATTSANAGYAIGAYSGVCIFPYKSSFGLITSTGQILYFNGGGFDELAHFPLYISDYHWGNLTSPLSYGDNVVVDGDIVYINLGFSLQENGRKGERFYQKNPAGVWCYDPSVGLYHRYAPSNSRMYFHLISQANVNTTTDVITTSAPIPDTGNPLIITNESLGGFTNGTVYYVIKLSDTTFQIAQTKELAIAGVYMDITSATSPSYAFLYDIVDYGVSYFTESGAIGVWGSSELTYRDVIFGGRYLDTSLGAQKTLNTAVPLLENRGYVVLPKLYLDSAVENVQKLYIKHSPLDINDSILVKIKAKEYFGLPIASPNSASNDEFIWTGSKEGYTSTDLSEAKTALDAGEELEIEFTAGVGAGQCVKVTSLETSDGVYSIVLKEAVVGAQAGLKSHFVIDNWKEYATVNFSTQKEGLFEVSINAVSKSPQIKIELRGYETRIEDIIIDNKSIKTI